MADLRPIPVPHLLERVLAEPARQGSLFDLPLRKWWRPSGEVDLSVAVHGHRAETPVGPAAGPHAQLAQNIVLSWLAGSRVIELKTVQILDQLEIPRPCIDAATVGYNVEWSQELRLEESLREYVVGWMLLRILRELDPLGLGAAAMARAEPVLELSVGYDLAGLQSDAMRAYLQRVKDVRPLVDELRGEVGRFRDLDYRADMISCVTLSTFHGCPAGEVEAIARYLLDEHDVDVIIKLNPTLLGHDEVCHLLHDRMGYHELRPKRAAFDGDLRWEEAIAMSRRLAEAAAARGRSFGIKMTNTLVVENHKTFFGEKEMYLSGAPLHVLAMHCTDRFRAALGTLVQLSFSGGVDQHNFADSVACDLVPVTTCTDLLRPGGYGRLPRYLDNLAQAMRDCGARDRDEFILRRFGNGPEAVRLVFAELREEGFHTEAPSEREALAALVDTLESELLAAMRRGGGLPLDAIVPIRLPRAGGDAPSAKPIDLVRRIVAAAGVLNTHEATTRATGDPRYAAGKNAKPPRKVGSTLVLLDCLSCDKCVPVCPNDANFSIPTPPEEHACEDVILDEGAVARAPGGIFRVAKPEQWANYADACNECGNCDVFCPEDGGPYVLKARFFGSAASMEKSPSLDGLLVERDGPALRVRARLAGARYDLRVPLDGGPAALDDGRLRVEYDPASGAILAATPLAGAPVPSGPHRLPGTIFPTLRALVRGALDPTRLNPVSAAVPGATWPEKPATAGA